MWREELLALRRAPFATGAHALTLAYAAAAEASCFLELGWPLPVNVLDLFTEHRVETNGIKLPCDNSLVGALAVRGLAHIDAGKKEDMQRKFAERDTWPAAERPEGLAYCMTDADALAALLPVMSIDLRLALVRGRYAAAVARMQRAGVPIDVPLYRRVVESWDSLKHDLITDVDAAFGVYEDGHFRTARFQRWLIAHGITDWPRTEVSGTLALDDDTFLEQAALRPDLPELQTLRELRATLGRMRLIGLEIGEDQPRVAHAIRDDHLTQRTEQYQVHLRPGAVDARFHPPARGLWAGVSRFRVGGGRDRCGACRRRPADRALRDWRSLPAVRDLRRAGAARSN
jgi:hypothetical protein